MSCLALCFEFLESPHTQNECKAPLGSPTSHRSSAVIDHRSCAVLYQLGYLAIKFLIFTCILHLLRSIISSFHSPQFKHMKFHIFTCNYLIYWSNTAQVGSTKRFSYSCTSCSHSRLRYKRSENT